MPVASADFVALDESEVCVQIYRVMDDAKQLIYVGAEQLATMFDCRLKEELVTCFLPFSSLIDSVHGVYVPFHMLCI